MSMGPARSVAEEFDGVVLGDARLDARLGIIVRALEARPDAGFPQAMGSDAASEGFYRFVGNDRVTWDRLAEGHIRKTHERASKGEVILAVHDTTLCQFEGDDLRDGLFRSAQGKSGFLAHTCIGVSGDGSRLPLGLLGMVPVVRQQFGARTDGPGKVYENEAHRWSDLVAIVDDEVPVDVRVIHVMDREGDAYELLDFLHLLEVEYVVRLAHDRRVLTEGGPDRLSSLLQTAPVKLDRTVLLSPRSDTKRPLAVQKAHPARDEREAKLEVRVLTTRLARPRASQADADELPVNVVHVVEVDPPEGETPVSWTLVTSLPVETSEQIAAVIDAYRARWLIEEFFKALKTGCSYEKRQLESLDALLVAFSLLAPIAWRLLALRWVSRNDQDRPATDVLTEEQVRFLRQVDNETRERLPAKPTVREAMFAIARLGGFLKRNKEPGWQTLGRGLLRFNDMFRGYVIATGGAVSAEDPEM